MQHSTVLKKAEIGIYNENETRNILPVIEKKYFKKLDTKYYISNDIKKLVTFKKHDLIMDEYEKDFDLIVCRNVVIYFKNEAKKEIFRKFSNSLKVGGFYL